MVTYREIFQQFMNDDCSLDDHVGLKVSLQFSEDDSDEVFVVDIVDSDVMSNGQIVLHGDVPEDLLNVIEAKRADKESGLEIK